MSDYAQAFAFIDALTGDATNAICDFRAISDTRQDIPAVPFRGTLADCWNSIVTWNAQRYGIFVTVAAMDGAGRELSNVQQIRAHYVDLDNLSAQQNYELASRASPAPGFAVNSSPNKYHCYWPVSDGGADIERFKTLQRKLASVFDGDKRVIDAARVMRLPGTYHHKLEPHLVTCHALAGYGQPTTIAALEAALAHVVVIEGSSGRHELGDPALSAPSLDWVKAALDMVDPNELDRGGWLGLTCAIKQAAWNHADEQTICDIWLAWCARYANDDVRENQKQWNSIRNTELGWNSVCSRIPSLRAHISLGAPSAMPANAAPGADASAPPMPEPPKLDCSGAMLTDVEQRQWFDGVVYVVNLGEMFTSDNRFLGTGQFNVLYGGKTFIWTQDGKTTDEPWKAATRSTLWTVPKVDHIRFLPSHPYGEIIKDDMKRTGINTYKPVEIRSIAGDATPFTRHIAAMLPDVGDQKILLDYLAHNVKFPGEKIPWAPVIQSVEGAGKGVLKLVMKHCMGQNYTYFPNAKELADSGSKFNAWMRNKLFILADEIKVDDRMDMIEILKPMISEPEIEIQGKGQDQGLEDNFSNWLFFSNWKTAIPVNKNGRRFSVMFSALQTVQDLLDRGMNDTYFKALYDWLRADGAAIVAHYLLNYPIERGAIPMRAPDTSTTAEARHVSRGPIERAIAEAVEDELPGFRAGWVSDRAVHNRIKAIGGRPVAAQTLEGILGSMGYQALGRAPREYFQEGPGIRAYLFHLNPRADMAAYGELQGYGA